MLTLLLLLLFTVVLTCVSTSVIQRFFGVYLLFFPQMFISDSFVSKELI